MRLQGRRRRAVRSARLQLDVVLDIELHEELLQAVEVDRAGRFELGRRALAEHEGALGADTGAQDPDDHPDSTVGSVLSAWRTAERRLAELDPDGPEWARAQAEIDHFRTEYQRLARTERARQEAPQTFGVG